MLQLLYRWPSVRPDDIVTEEDFLKVKGDSVGDERNIAAKLTKRTRWDEGLKLDDGKVFLDLYFYDVDAF